MITLEATQGSTRDYILQILNPDGTIPNQFLQSDNLTSAVWEGQNQATIFSPTVSWFTGVSAINLTVSGAGYTNPTVTIGGGGGTGATATAIFDQNSGAITSLLLTNSGTGYSTNPGVVITDPTGGGATATATAAIGWQYGQVALEITGASTTTLDPAGTYHLQVYATRASVQACVIDCLLRVVASPGSVVPAPPDLITYDYAEAMFSELDLSDGQIDFIPYLVKVASSLVRKFCFDRYFDLRTITETDDIALNGQIRLLQVPVQQILRVQCQPQLALTVVNNSPSVQVAQAYFTYTGTVDGYGTAAQTATGMYLNWVSNGTPANVTVSYTVGMTVAQLATAITAVGSGWTATPFDTTNIGLWPVTELTGGYAGQGAAMSAIPGDGAQFNVLLDLSNYQLDNPYRGFVTVGRQYQSSNALRWGPGGGDMWGYDNSTNYQLSQAKVTYIGGYPTIPAEVQYWTGQTVKWLMELDKQELLLIAEKAADYSYEISPQLIHRIPRTVQEGLSGFRLHYA